MNFELTEERRMLADSLDRFLAAQLTPATRRNVEAREGYSRVIWDGLTEIGALGALFPEDAGGFGGAGFDVSAVFESLGRGLAVEPVLGALVVGRAILASGSATCRDDLMPGIINGRSVAALAHDEPHAHYELAHVAVRAVKSPGGWTLSGRKAVVVHGDRADLLLVSARTSGAVNEDSGISLFVVPADAAGLLRHSYTRIDGGRAADIEFKEVQLPATALLGVEGEGLPVLEQALGWGVLALCAEALGAMEVAKQHTLEFLRTRKQFGVPIGSFQALQHRMAELLLGVEQARSAVINAAAAMEKDRVFRELALAAAKYSIGSIGARVAEECIQMHGGIGMTWELPLAHYAKRLVMIDHQFGDEDHHLARYVELSHFGGDALHN